MNIENVLMPEFLLCENPIKNGNPINDYRSFIYCPKYLSLIEVISMDDLPILYDTDLTQKNYNYYSETFTLVFIQNNVSLVEQTNEIIHLQNNTKPLTDLDILAKAWDWYKDYLKWEDSL